MSARSPVNAIGLVVAAALVALGAQPAASADWQFNPKIEGGFEANSNYRLFASGFEDRVYGVFTNAAFQFRFLSPTDDFSITPAVYASELPDSTEDNTTDPSVNLNWTHTGQTFTTGLFSQYLRQSVVQADLTTANNVGNQLGNPVGGDSGYLTQHDRRQLAEVTPTLTADLTQRWHLNVTADYVDVSYHPVITGFNVGYNSANATVGLIRDLSQRMTLTVRGLIAQYDPQGADVGTTRSYGAEGEWGYHISQISQAYIRVGAERSSFEQVAGTAAAPDTTGVVAGAGMNWNYQVTQVFLDATRTVEPNATGYTVDRNQLRLSLTRLLSPMFSGEVGGRYYRDSPTEPTILFADRNYGVGYVGFKWRFRRAWTLNGEYDYTYQHYASAPPVTESSNAVVLSIIYEPNRVK
jgi:hypothetical protein